MIANDKAFSVSKLNPVYTSAYHHPEESHVRVSEWPRLNPVARPRKVTQGARTRVATTITNA